MNSIDEGIKMIYEKIVKNVLGYLKTGEFHEKDPKNFMEAYRYLLY
jgi:hypothetical protein